MKLIDTLPIDNRIKDVFLQEYDDLYEIQYNAILNGLQAHHYIVNIPTSSGKSYISEILAMNNYFKTNKKIIYLSPIKALCWQQYKSQTKWCKLGLTRGISIGDFYVNPSKLQNVDILVMTYERFDSLIRKNINWLKDIGCVVIDEMHIIGKENRGENIEFIMSYLKLNDIKTISLTATIGNLDEISNWYEATTYQHDERMHNITYGVVKGGTIHKDNGESEKVGKNYLDIVMDRLNNDKQILIFVRTRNESEKLAKKISNMLNLQLDKEIVSENIQKRFKDVLNTGVLFHNGSLKKNERRYVEEAFSDKRCRILIATPTLAMGVNTPCDLCIVKDLIRFNSDETITVLDVQDVKQMLGRAGRYGSGEGYIVTTKNHNEIMNKYIREQVEDVKSQLFKSSKLKSFIMSIINLGYNTFDDICHFMSFTLMYYQYENKNMLNNKIKKELKWLVENEFLTYSDVYTLTMIGEKCLTSYISPESILSFTKYVETNDFKTLDILFDCVEIEKLNIHKKEMAYYYDYAKRHEIGLLNGKNVEIMNEYINGVKAEIICDKYKITISDFSTMLDEIKWMLYGLHEIYKIINSTEKLKYLEDLYYRLEYNVNSECVELVKQKGIGKKKAEKIVEKKGLDKWL